MRIVDIGEGWGAALLVLGLPVLTAGWWYWRNIQLYGDPTGLNMILDVVGRRAVRALGSEVLVVASHRA